MVKHIYILSVSFFHLFHFFRCKMCEIEDRNCKVILVSQDGAQAHVKSSRAALCSDGMSPVKSLSSCRKASFFPRCRCHTVSLSHQEDMLEASMSYWVCVIREIPRSTATQLSDADKSCHLRNIIQGRMRTPTCSWSHRQTNKLRLGVCRGGVDKMQRREALHPVGCLQTPLKSPPLLVLKQHKVSRSKGKRSPLSPSGQQEKGWMNLKQTSERLTVSQTAQQRNQLPRAGGQTGGLSVSDWYVMIKSFDTLQHHVRLVNNTSSYCSLMQSTTIFVVTACTHSSRAIVILVCIHAVHFCVCVCVFVRMIDLATETLSNATLQILPKHSLWNRSACLIQRKIEDIEYDLHLRAAAHRRPWTSFSCETNAWWGSCLLF